jgi:thymidine phosphorylase
VTLPSSSKNVPYASDGFLEQIRWQDHDGAVVAAGAGMADKQRSLDQSGGLSLGHVG